MTYLLVSLVALAAGPLFVSWARRAPAAAIFVDAFVVVVIGGLVLLHVLPESLATGGWPAFGLLLVGVFAPLLADRGLRTGGGSSARWILIVLALIGLGLHAAVDGVALGDGPEHGGVLIWAVLAHRIPVGVSIWWIVPRTLGNAMGVVALLVTALGTIVGFSVGPGLLTGSANAIALFEALLCGSLLHVILHAHIPAPKGAKERRLHVASVLGLLSAVLVVAGVTSEFGGAAESGTSSGSVFLTLALESAPALLFAYLAVGASQAFLPPDWFERASGGGPLGQALRGVAIGLPLPVCSCGVVPIYRGLIVRGSAVTAAVAFLIATPELEIAAVLLSVQLLGPELAVARVVAAAVLAVSVGLLLGVLLPKAPRVEPSEVRDDPRPRPSLVARIRTMFRFGFGEAVDHTATWLLAGLGISALAMPHLDPEMIARLPSGLDVPIAALLGAPIYVCASGSTPLAAVLIYQGLSPGAALAFLLTGPATNITTFGMLTRLHGRRAAAVFSLSVCVAAIFLGYLVNWSIPRTPVPLSLEPGHDGASAVQTVSLAILTAVFVGSLLRQGTRGFIDELFITPGHDSHSHDSECC